jgi:hypothetical protein
MLYYIFLEWPTCRRKFATILPASLFGGGLQIFQTRPGLLVYSNHDPNQPMMSSGQQTDCTVLRGYVLMNTNMIRNESVLVIMIALLLLQLVETTENSNRRNADDENNC